ncbi:MAG TPA: hypothetical protein PKA28_09090 [Methylomusa anaerophila]|uniref:Uncharacterized protein n=1 Tax=Methylomusa anaerophila TaxID=1930071 RepID=A0A348AKS7_9FIRM|nr:hypothetical protein [Methylomusa anaerophila]BBB91675.1 hypothetical protein MAMMFC1_02359 [Methylomusa anaerophila]HML88591.1 hypothetical protein [Methylomusa anaerophila]
MFLSYTASVIVVSLALYGLWHFIKDLWEWYANMELVCHPNSSLLILVKNMENEIEDLMRFLILELESAGEEHCDAVVIDLGSQDLTLAILTRMATQSECFTFISLPHVARPVEEALPMCRGGVVHVLDLTSRLTAKEFIVSVSALLRQDTKKVAVKFD